MQSILSILSCGKLTEPCLVTCRLSQELELKQHALALLKERMAGSESAQLADTVATLEAELAGEEEAAKTAKEAKESMVATAKVRGLGRVSS